MAAVHLPHRPRRAVFAVTAVAAAGSVAELAPGRRVRRARSELLAEQFHALSDLRSGYVPTVELGARDRAAVAASARSEFRLGLATSWAGVALAPLLVAAAVTLAATGSFGIAFAACLVLAAALAAYAPPKVRLARFRLAALARWTA